MITNRRGSNHGRNAQSKGFSVGKHGAKRLSLGASDGNEGRRASLSSQVPDAKEYQQYKPTHVRNSFDRLVSINGSVPIEHQWLTRAEFNEAFSDYSTIPHICLPLRMFDYFVDRSYNPLLPSVEEDDAEPGHHTKVRAGEVLILLCILCDGSRVERVNLLRDIFVAHHASEDGSVSQETFKPIL